MWFGIIKFAFAQIDLLTPNKQMYETKTIFDFSIILSNDDVMYARKKD